MTDVERWPFWLGGLAIGLFVVGFRWFGRKPLGVSTGFADACGAAFDPTLRQSWRLPFLVGIVFGGFLSAALAGGWSPTWQMGRIEEFLGSSRLTQAVGLMAGGTLLGFGARMAGGCTSGHGIVGVALANVPSLIATALFMVGGFATVNLLGWVMG